MNRPHSGTWTTSDTSWTATATGNSIGPHGSGFHRDH
ncbi:hypothetical protein ACVWZD_000364 [Streptomyces sp. TE3672]